MRKQSCFCHQTQLVGNPACPGKSLSPQPLPSRGLSESELNLIGESALACGLAPSFTLVPHVNCLTSCLSPEVGRGAVLLWVRRAAANSPSMRRHVIRTVSTCPRITWQRGSCCFGRSCWARAPRSRRGKAALGTCMPVGERERERDR